jgi:ribosomal protein S18 acetylase RimI-like enzyme
MARATAAGVVLRPMAPADVDAVKALFAEYERWLDAPQCFADFNREMADLAAAFVAVLVAEADRRIDGAVALKDRGERTAEIKRLYCRPGLRGRGVGERLMREAIERARDLGYRAVTLTTFPRLTAAVALYRKLGFHTELATPAEIGMSLALGVERRLG